MDEFGSGPAGDAAIIACGQKIEQHEICGYGTVIKWAETLGYKPAIKLLTETLREESAANDRLDEIATNQINQEAPKANIFGNNRVKLL
jgi:ferritin-like metal-binding protein YciE